MKRMSLLRVATALFLIGALASVWEAEGLAQAQEGAGSDGQRRPAQVDFFGGSAYTGGHLKYSYKVSREGVEAYSITTTEIIPLDGGMYRIENSSTDLVTLGGVNIAFFGISLPGVGTPYSDNFG